MSNFNPRGGKCDACSRQRSLRDGLCHECEQAERDAAMAQAESDDDEWVAPGVVGARL